MESSPIPSGSRRNGQPRLEPGPSQFHPAQRLPGAAGQLMELSFILGSIPEGFSEQAHTYWIHRSFFLV